MLEILPFIIFGSICFIFVLQAVLFLTDTYIENKERARLIRHGEILNKLKESK